MELLWTDKCFLSMLLLGIVFFCNSLRKEHSRRTLRRFFHRPLALSSTIVLFFFLMIGVLDSIHFKSMSTTNAEMSTNTRLSILDKVLAPVGQTYEKTYSAPLALHAYTTETLFVEGIAKQHYPRLLYPPKQIVNKKDKNMRLGISLIKALFISLIPVLVLGWLISFSKKKRSNHPLLMHPKSVLLTLFFCLFLSTALYLISREFHVFGTGKIGQDIFYYTVKSIRTGLIIGTLTTLFMLPLAIILGIAAGYFGGIVDDIIQYIYTTLSSIPGVLLITASVLSMQTYIANHPEQFSTLEQNADARLFALCLILGVSSWTSLCRILRAETLKLREIDFVLAARALGSNIFRIFYSHLLPNTLPVILITVVLDFSFLVLSEAVLSYVGVGVSPMTISWGNMINSARLELARDPIVWWPMAAAFIFMFMMVLACNIFADALRDSLDPNYAES